MADVSGVFLDFSNQWSSPREGTQKPMRTPAYIGIRDLHRIDANEIAILDQTICKFVKEYERLYYHDDPERLTCCKINNHRLATMAAWDGEPAR
jgi:hypothetical protein